MTLRIHPTEIVRQSQSPLLSVHPSWSRVPLGDIAEVRNGFAFKSEFFDKGEGVPLLRIRDVGGNSTETRYSGRYDPSYIVRPGEIVVGMDGDFRVARWGGPEALLNQRVCKVVLRDRSFYDEAFLLYVLPGYLNAIHDFTSSVTVKHLSSESIKEIPLPLPPLAEQRRIVAAIEEQFSRIDAGVEALHRARRNLQRMRAAVFQAAVMGRLVPQDSEAEHAEILVRRLFDEHPEARKYTLEFRAHSPPKLPTSWTWVAVGQVGEAVTGRTPDTRRVDYFGPGLPFVTPGDLGEELILLGAARELTEAGAAMARPLPASSVLVTCIGATIGKVGLAGVPCATNQQINALIPFESYAQPRWVFYAMASPWFFELMRSEASSTTMPILNKSRFQALPMPLPPFSEQARIVVEVERHLSFLDNLRVTVKNNLGRAGQLRRSILSSAFAGYLVAQDESDGPASVLLERLKAARVAREPRRVRFSRRLGR